MLNREPHQKDREEIMLEELKKQVCDANQALPRRGLASFSWGNVSGIDRENGLVVIKPRGVEYERLTPENMVVVSLRTGDQVEGNWEPASDTPTHLALYRAFPNIGSIAHTHSRWATAFAQAGKSIPPLGMTHVDYFHGEIPCTRKLVPEEIERNYEEETGKVIVECFRWRNANDMPAVLVNSHGPFAWGTEPADAVTHAAVLEEVAFMAYHAMMLTPGLRPVSLELQDRYYLHDHGQSTDCVQK